MDVASGIIAAFTVVIAISTGIYTWVTWRLWKQTRDAFLVDMVSRMYQHIRKVALEAKDLEEAKEALGYYKGMTTVVRHIDKKIAKELERVLKTFWEVYFKKPKGGETTGSAKSI